MFNPGETVSHQFIIPFVASELSKVIVSYKQDGDIVFEKTITSGFEPYYKPDESHEEVAQRTMFTIAFSQEESLLFSPKKDFKAQINVFTTRGSRATSKEIEGKNGAQYHREVINNAL